MALLVHGPQNPFNGLKNEIVALVKYTTTDNEEDKQEDATGVMSLKTDMGGEISKTNIPGDQFGKSKSDLVAFINNRPYTEDMIQEAHQNGDGELSISPGKADRGDLRETSGGNSG